MTGRKAINVEDYNETIKLAHSIDQLTTGIGAKKLIYLSSSAVYGKGQRHTENGQTRPIGYYGLSKKKSEDILLKKSIGKYYPQYFKSSKCRWGRCVARTNGVSQ